jgi:hypothetical protein
MKKQKSKKRQSLNLLDVKEQKEFKVSIQGTGTGTFGFDIQKTVGDIVKNEALFSHIPVSSSTKVELVYSSDTGASNLSVDTDGNGEVDEIVQNEIISKQETSEIGEDYHNNQDENQDQDKNENKENNYEKIGNSVQAQIRNIKTRLQTVGRKILEAVQNRQEDVGTDNTGHYSEEGICIPC